MAVRIVPTKGTKEEYLWANAIEITKEEAKFFEFTSEEAEVTSVVVLTTNAWGSNAEVMFDKIERETLLSPDDLRPKSYFKIDKDYLACPESGIPDKHYQYLDIRV